MQVQYKTNFYIELAQQLLKIVNLHIKLDISLTKTKLISMSYEKHN